MVTRKNCKKRRNRRKTVRGGKHLRDMDWNDILELFKSLPTRTKNALMRTLKRKHPHNSNDIELTSLNSKKTINDPPPIPSRSLAEYSNTPNYPKNDPPQIPSEDFKESEYKPPIPSKEDLETYLKNPPDYPMYDPPDTPDGRAYTALMLASYIPPHKSQNIVNLNVNPRYQKK